MRGDGDFLARRVCIPRSRDAFLYAIRRLLRVMMTMRRDLSIEFF